MLRADSKRSEPIRSTRETWFDHAILAVALTVLLSGFGTIVEGNDWWVTTMLIALMTGSTCALLRGLGLRIVAPFAILVELLALAWIFVPETLMAIVPTGQTFSALADLAAMAREIILEEQAPVGAAKPIVLVVASSFGLIVIIGDALLHTRWAAPLIGLLFMAVFATPALISGETPSVWLFVTVAALWLVLLRSRTAVAAFGAGRSGPTVILGSAALAAAVIFPLVSPDVSAVATGWGKPPPTVFGRGINPMLELGQNLRRNSTATALTYTTSADEAQYLKVATLRDFTGKTWKPSTGLGPRGIEGELGIYSEIPYERQTTRITIDKLRSSMLPVPYPALNNVAGLEGEWSLRSTGLTLSSQQDDSQGQTYTVTSLDLRPTAEQMRGIRTFADADLQPYLALPSDMPTIIADTARKVTADANNDYDRVMSLQRHFRYGTFRYSESAPVADGYDGNGVDVIAKFLDVKAGYCVHFSSAMAVMARTLGIPSRIAVGYAPGDSIGLKDGKTEYEATSDDLHAWTEIFFQGVGWLRFDPTTGVGSGTGFEEPAASVSGYDSADPVTTQGATPTRPDESAESAAATPTDSQTAPRTALVTLGGLLIIGAVPWLLRSVRRRWRLRAGRPGVEPLWRELEDVARDFRIPASAGDTPRGFASRLRQRPGVDVDALDGLLGRVEMSRYARDSTQDGDGAHDLRAVTASIRAGGTWRERLRATMLPRSLAESALGQWG